MSMYLQLFIAAMVPVCLSVVFYMLDRLTGFKHINYWTRQIIIGVVFGVAAVLGTEWGIDVGGATANARDAAPMCAGLLFGGPAGIIAGLIGGIERWFAVAWGAGMFSRVACSVSTCIAGFYAAFLRKYLFENKRPHWTVGFFCGIVMEVLHLTVLFLTNLATPEKAFTITSIVAVPMILINGIAVMISICLFTILENDSEAFTIRNRRISDTLQRSLLILIISGFILTIAAVQKIETGFARNESENNLKIAIDDIKADVKETSDDQLMTVTKAITLLTVPGTTNDELDVLAELYGVSEISVVDRNGKITSSTNRMYIGFDFAQSEQSSEFLVLLGPTNSFVQSFQPIGLNVGKSMKYAGYKQIGGGFVQVGYDANDNQRVLSDIVNGVTRNRHIGLNGYIIVCDSNGKIVSDSTGHEGYNINSLGITINDIEEDDKLFVAIIDGVECDCMHSTEEGYHILAAAPRSEVYQSNRMNICINMFMEILLFSVLFIFIYLMIKRVVVTKIHKINEDLTVISEGNLNQVIDVRSSVEFSELSDYINETVDTLKDYIAEAAARIDKELEFAKHIQASALPNVFPAFPHRTDFDIYARMDTAKEVGGDFYDFYATHRDTFNFLIADVSGKGIPAAMFMMRGKTQLKSLTESNIKVNDVFTQGNNNLCEGNDANMFITAWQGQIDLTNGHVEFANAGHNPPLVKHAGGQFEYLKSRPGFMLAGMEGVKYKLQELQLERGDIIFLYTDGVTEATDANTELYGEDRLQKILNSREFTDMKELCDTVKADVDAFVGDAEQFDDITMLAFIYKGKDKAPEYHQDHARIADITELTAFVEEQLEKINCPMKAQMQIDIAIDELYSNIVNYAYDDPEGGPATVIINNLIVTPGVEITFIDEGRPYNPLTKEDPDITLKLEDRGVGGLGIYMVKNSMDDMSYEYKNDKNMLKIVKYF